MKWSNTVLIVFVIAGLVAFFYVANRFSGGERGATTEKPITTCQPVRQAQGKPENAPLEQQKCFWTAHIHATLKVFMKGEEVSLGFEEGDLDRAHTHAEKNKIHWHALIPVDPKTKEVTDWSSFTVSNLSLGGREGPRKFIVNGREVEPSYIWQDGDVIEIHYE